MCTCRHVHLLFTAAEQELRYRAVPRPRPSTCSSAVGRPRDPGRVGVLLRQLNDGPDGVFLSARQEPLSRSCPSTRGACRRQQPNAARRAGGRRGALSFAFVQGAMLNASWCRSTCVTSWSGDCAGCGAASMVGRTRAGRSTTSSNCCSQGASGMTEHPGDLTFTVVDITPEPYAVVPNLLACLRIEESSGEPVHAVAPGCQVRIELRGAATTTRRKLDCSTCSARDSAGGHAQDVPVDACGTMVPGFTGSTEVTLPLVRTYDFEASARACAGAAPR